MTREVEIMVKIHEKDEETFKNVAFYRLTTERETMSRKLEVVLPLGESETEVLRYKFILGLLDSVKVKEIVSVEDIK